MLIDSFQTHIYFENLSIIFKGITKFGKFTNDMAQYGVLTLKFAPKIQMKIDQFTQFIKDNLDPKSYVVFLNDDPDYAYIEKTIFTDIYNLGVNV